MMLEAPQILVSARGRVARMVCLAALAGSLSACGQRGPLYLPETPAAANRATLPQVLTPGGSRDATADEETTTRPPASSAPAATPDTPR